MNTLSRNSISKMDCDSVTKDILIKLSTPYSFYHKETPKLNKVTARYHGSDTDKMSVGSLASSCGKISRCDFFREDEE